MSIFPGRYIRENYGLVDVHLIRRVYLPEEEFAISKKTQHGIELVIEDIVADLNEIVRTRVRSLGGNCLIGYKVSINGFDQIVEDNKVYLIMSAIGDAVLLEESKPGNVLRSSIVSEDLLATSSKHSDRQVRSEFNIEEEQKDSLRMITDHNHKNV